MIIESGGEAPGTRFLLFPQSPFLTDEPVLEVIEISAPPGTVGPGPSDRRMYAVDPLGKTVPYGALIESPAGEQMYLPPWHGPRGPAPVPDAEGHFLHVTPDDPGFESAHIFAAAHFTLDVWEGYFGHEIPWHFALDFERLELSLLPGLDNAHIGWGFLETGGSEEHGGEYRPYSLNFDVVAHEIGHAIVYSVIGMPSEETAPGEYYGFHESAADMVSLLAALHFGSVVETLLAQTSGNLYTFNQLSRFAELSESAQIRMAANTRVLSEFAGGWSSEHSLSEPLTGALFDILVDIFHERLLVHGLITAEMEDLSDHLEDSPEYGAVMQGMFDVCYARAPEGFRLALVEARDFMGTYLAEAWQLLDADSLSYAAVAEALLHVDREITGGAFETIIEGNFRMREIGLVEPGPRLPESEEDSHAHSVRTRVPE